MTSDELILTLLRLGYITADPDTGAIYSCRQRGRRGEPVRLPGSDCRGYRLHTLAWQGVHKTVRAHRIVWMDAHGPIPAGLVLDHINRDRADNRLANLRLVTPAANTANGPDRRGGNNARARLTAEDVRRMRALSRAGASCRVLAARFGISRSQVHNIVRGRQWTTEEEDG